MALQSLGHLAGGHVKDVDDAVDGTGRNVLAVGTLPTKRIYLINLVHNQSRRLT